MKHTPRIPVLRPPEKITDMTEQSIEVSVAGKWKRVPALKVLGRNIIVVGKMTRTAIIHDEEWLETALDDPEASVQELKKGGQHGLSPDLFTFAQKPPDTVRRFGYQMEFDSIAAARTSDFKEWWEKLPQETRKNVRRAQKRGVVVAVSQLDDTLVKGIAAVNNESSTRQGRPNRHYGKSLDLVRKDHESFLDRSDFIGAYLDHELIGYLKVVYRGDTASILNIVSKSCHQDKRPSNALLAKAIELCEARGVTHLIYGRYHYGRKRNSSLLEFKIRHGFGELLIPRYYIALTKWGALCLRLKLHRGLIEMVPPGIIEMASMVRAKWYHARNRWAGVAQ